MAAKEAQGKNAELYRRLEIARGKNRSFRQYAEAAGVRHSIFNKIKNNEFTPGLTTLQRLASKEANPQGGITLSDLVEAAGIKIDYEGLAKSFSALSRAAVQIRPQVDFQNTVVENISSALSAHNTRFELQRNEGVSIIGLDPLDTIVLHDCPLKAIDITSWYASSPEDYGGYGSPDDRAIEILRRPVILPPDSSRKVVLAVNSPAVYEILKKRAGKMSYRGWLSAVLLDFDTNEIIDETVIATYTEKTKPDPLPLKQGKDLSP